MLFSSPKCTWRVFSGVLVTEFKRSLQYSLHLPRMSFSLPKWDTILAFDGSSSMRYFAAKMPYSFPEHFVEHVLVHQKKQNYCIICTTRLSHKLCLWNRIPTFRLRLQPSKIAWAPVLQPCLKLINEWKSRTTTWKIVNREFKNRASFLDIWLQYFVCFWSQKVVHAQHHKQKLWC